MIPDRVNPPPAQANLATLPASAEPATAAAAAAAPAESPLPTRLVGSLASPGSSGRLGSAWESARMWGAISSASARRLVSYRAAILASIVSNIVLTVLRGHLALAVWTHRPGLAGYDSTAAVTFTVLGQSLVTTFAVFGGMIDIPWRVRNGSIEVDLVRPLGFQRWYLGLEVGRAAVYLASRALPAAIVGVLLFDLRLPRTAGAAAAFAVSLGLALLVSFGLRYLVALSAFWMTDFRGVQAVSALVMMFFSGAVLPLVLFPGALGTIAGLLPFGAVIQTPMDLYLGTADDGPVRALAFQAAWALVLLLAGQALTSRAIRRLVVQNG
ncbi:ABC-2 type transport system permease protein [Parafrankia irregularis]|uniref:ABC-2 type transport system permease protein n=1 Tax=Parafrankia irregularis TaxID=795642 RepID=A0A0S4QK71_9ACTN|nr:MULTISPECIES: ABC-2 family transporter protein [Parafrankia]MBE3202196.1 ABC-2 family transporter protein [Parafrankia sp. CH37]CUU55985.1 ABC-2 type transport system permease protein [Parafrankia irregularis]